MHFDFVDTLARTSSGRCWQRLTAGISILNYEHDNAGAASCVSTHVRCNLEGCTLRRVDSPKFMMPEIEKLTSARTTQTEGAPFFASFAKSGRHTVNPIAAQKMTPSYQPAKSYIRVRICRSGEKVFAPSAGESKPGRVAQPFAFFAKAGVFRFGHDPKSGPGGRENDSSPGGTARPLA
jgi:hypothetical protein